MNERAARAQPAGEKVRATPTASRAPGRSSGRHPRRPPLAQRRCGCGGKPGPSGECAECRRGRLRAQGPADAVGAPRPASQAPPAVGGISPGHDLERVSVVSRPPSRAVVGQLGDGGGAAAEPVAEPAAPATTSAEGGGAAAGGGAGTTAGLSWTHVLRHPSDALWFFCGAEPRYFSTTAVLRASGAANPAGLEWFITRGADKVFSETGYTGPEITLKSTAGSVRPDDVSVKVAEGIDPAAPSYTGRLTVRRPHRLAPTARGVIGARDRNWDGGFLSFVSYRMVDNVGGTIIGGTTNELFGAETNHVANNWPVPAHLAGRDVDLDGVITDVIGVRGLPAFNPQPQTPGPARTPAAALSTDRVDTIQQTFSIGSLTPGDGCRVQTNDFVRYRDHGRHENIVSPAP